MSKIRNVYDRFIVILLTGAAALGGFSAVLATVNALCRKILSISFPWAEELATYMVVVAVFLAIPHLEWNGRQLTVDLLGNSLKKPLAKKIMAIFSSVIVIVVCCVVVRYGMDSTITAYQTDTRTFVMQWPRAIFFGIGVAGFVLAIISSIAAIFLKGNERGGLK